MGSWRDQILSEFTPQVARLTLVADPDGLLLEEGVLEGIRERGFELIPFEDHVAFRYAYESKFRSRWDRGEKTDLVVVLRSASQNLMPYPTTCFRPVASSCSTWAISSRISAIPWLRRSTLPVSTPCSMRN